MEPLTPFCQCKKTSANGRGSTDALEGRGNNFRYFASLVLPVWSTLKAM